MTGSVQYLDAGAFGVDYSFSKPAISDMLAIGVQFVSRYICFESASTRGKLVTLDEIRRLADAGILMMVHYEQSIDTTLGGATAGHRHGAEAARWRDMLGIPHEMPMVFSTDTGVTSAQWSAIRDFMHAAKAELGGQPVGHYHGTPLMQHLEDNGVNDLSWMAMATSWSNPLGETDRVHVRQKGYVLGVCDANYVRRRTPFWNYNGEPGEIVVPDHPGVPVEVPDLAYSILAVEGAWARFAGIADSRGMFDQVHWINAGAEEWLRSQGCPTYTKPLAALPGIILVGALPTDTDRQWKESDWLYVLNPTAAQAGASADHVHDLTVDGAVVHVGPPH